MLHINFHHERFLKQGRDVSSTADGVREFGVIIDREFHSRLACSTVGEKVVGICQLSSPLFTAQMYCALPKCIHRIVYLLPTRFEILHSSMVCLFDL